MATMKSTPMASSPDAWNPETFDRQRRNILIDREKNMIEKRIISIDREKHMIERRNILLDRAKKCLGDDEEHPHGEQPRCLEALQCLQGYLAHK